MLIVAKKSESGTYQKIKEYRVHGGGSTFWVKKPCIEKMLFQITANLETGEGH